MSGEKKVAPDISDNFLMNFKSKAVPLHAMEALGEEEV
jgi:hypothetical protein